MTVLLVVAGLVLGMFTYEPMWFDTRPHYYSHTYESKEQCNEVRETFQQEIHFTNGKQRGAVCTDKHALYITK